jgi:trans-2,3-dihydro-3-hydroxyanthranilate isomerase
VHDADGIDDERMLAFAHETRLSETTFIQPPTREGADYRNRIFSMAGELPFAGHPSLGTAVAVARAEGVTTPLGYLQETGAGLQQVDVEPRDKHFRASMLQEPAQFGEQLEPAVVLAAVGLRPEDGHREFPPQVVSTGPPHVMLPLARSDALAQIRPDPEAVDAVLDSAGAYGVYAAAVGAAGRSARARLFTRTAQAAEDPATGSAAGPLCAYLYQRTGCASLEITQGVEMGRPSRLQAEVAGERVRVSGAVVAVVDGTLTL